MYAINCLEPLDVTCGLGADESHERGADGGDGDREDDPCEQTGDRPRRDGAKGDEDLHNNQQQGNDSQRRSLHVQRREREGLGVAGQTWTVFVCIFSGRGSTLSFFLPR